MIIKRHLALAFILALLAAQPAVAQIEAMLKECSTHLPAPYLSDGQEYRTLLNKDETAEFRIVFYGGSTYRLVGCGGKDKGLIFTVYDQDKNELFSNRDRANTPYWDLKFTATMTCTIEAQLPPDQNSGFAMLLIGFKQ